MNLDLQDKFKEAVGLAEKGASVQSLKMFQEISRKFRQDYCSKINLGVLYLQQGKQAEAKLTLQQAIRIDRYQYLAYYNLFIFSYQQLQRKQMNQQQLSCEDQLNQITLIYNYLYLALSCAYAELAEALSDSKLCTKALFYCEENSAAYANRARIYELDRKLKLAENDYASAIYYDAENPLFYMRRAEYYWRSNKFAQANEDSKTYWLLKNLQKNNMPPTFKQLVSKQISTQQADEFEQKIIEKVQQLQILLAKLREQSIQRQLKMQNKKFTQPQQKIQMISDVQKMATENKEQYLDQSSKNISQQIQKLQNQIRLQGGKLTESQSQSQSQSQQKQPSNEETFLTQQIEKTTKQIQHIKQLPNAKQARQSQTSVTSKYSQKFINIEDISHYKKILLEIVSAQFFDSQNKPETKVYATYAKQKKQTQFSKTNIWREKFDFKIDHNLHKKQKTGLDSDEQSQKHTDAKQEGQILLQLQMRSGSIFSSKKIIGRGRISIQQMGQNKCVLSNQRQKSGIIYFKVKLQ